MSGFYERDGHKIPLTAKAGYFKKLYRGNKSVSYDNSDMIA